MGLGQRGVSAMSKNEWAVLGENVLVRIEGNKMLIAVDLSQEGRPSSSGKTKLVGTTSGFKGISPEVAVSLNVTRK